jgi:hypothetical protein
MNLGCALQAVLIVITTIGSANHPSPKGAVLSGA